MSSVIQGPRFRPHTGTSPRGIIPMLLAFNVLLPEWPGAALRGAYRINFAQGLTSAALQKYAVVICMLGKADAAGQLPQVPLGKVFHGQAEKF